jgi:hypothetical protein
MFQILAAGIMRAVHFGISLNSCVGASKLSMPKIPVRMQWTNIEMTVDDAWRSMQTYLSGSCSVGSSTFASHCSK